MPMMNLWSALELGKNSLNAQQQVFQVIGQNIANVNTPGYSKQRAILETVPPPVLGIRAGGRGVNMASVETARDRFINNQIIDSMQLFGVNETLRGSMKTVESIFDESKGYGISNQMTTFFNSWGKLANNAKDTATRNNLIAQTKSFTDSINRSYDSLIEQQKLADSNIATIVGDVNEIAADIASLNEKIAYAKGTGNPASELIDKRELQLQKLSELVGTNYYFNQSNDSVTVEVAGRPLVNFSTVNKLSAVRDPNPPQYNQVFIDQYGGAPLDITNQIKNGKLEAHIRIRDQYIPQYKEELDNLITGLVHTINSQHQQGYALDGTTTDQNFFQMSTGTGTINAVAGNTVTFAGLGGNVSNTLEVGDIVTVGGQTKYVTSVTDPATITVDSAFSPSPPATLPASWEYFNRENAASRVSIDSAIESDPTLLAASAETKLTGTGNVTGSVGTTVNFDNNISATLAVGNTITIQGQTRTITAIGGGGTSVTIDSAFNPALSSLPLSWDYSNGTGAAGNNENATAIAGLMSKNNTVDSDRDGVADYGTLHEYLHTTFTNIGNHSASAQYELDSSKSMLNYLQNTRDQISGVSLDEETADLLTAQKSYQSIAQFISVVNKMTDVLISMGR